LLLIVADSVEMAVRLLLVLIVEVPPLLKLGAVPMGCPDEAGNNIPLLSPATDCAAEPDCFFKSESLAG
jgi:hypothetical protein